MFVADGDLVVERALDAGFRPEAVLVDAARRPAVVDRFGPEVPVYEASAAIAKALTGFGVVLDIVALFHRRPVPTLTEVLERTRRLVVFEQVDNPANIGAIVRSAAGLGFDGFVVDATSADPLARRSARASMGSVFRLPWARSGELTAALPSLTDAGFRLVALTPAPDADPIGAFRVGAADRVALLLGSERSGLSAAVLAAAQRCRIPMHAGVDSLNVAAAAAIACHVFGR